MKKYELTVDFPPVLQSLYFEMTDKLQGIIQEESDELSMTKQCIETVSKTLEELRGYILTASFAGRKEEIYFFKHIKPRFYSEYIYYVNLYQIQILIPTGSYEDEVTYLKKEFKKLNEYFLTNQAFYQYFRSGSENMDESYFTRGRINNGLLTDYFSPDADPRFSTSHDYKVSRILANERLKIYLNTSLEDFNRIDPAPTRQKLIDSEIVWTAPKAALIELIYALQSFGAFNYGEAEIKDISDHFERVFNINLGNLYRTFQEIRIRKKGRTYFLDQLKVHLIKRMDFTDENPR